VAVIVAGVAILWWDWRLADPLVTLLIAGYILWQSFAEIGPVIRVLMLGAPPQTDTEAVVAALARVPGVAGVHHAHLWQMHEHETSLEAHLVVEDGHWMRAEEVKAEARAALAGFGIGHSTLELERAGHGCAHAHRVGHDHRGDGHGDGHEHGHGHAHA
jgi:cobalt-zinc-cadmium efflux system protein